MPVEILCRRVNHDVHAVLKWSLQIGGQERVVRDRDHPRLASNTRDRGDIDDIQQRIAGGFDPNALRLRGQRVPNIRRIDHVDERKRDPHVAENVGKNPIRTAVNIVSGDDVIPWFEEVHHAGDRGHSRACCSTINASLQRSNAFFQRSPSRISTACVVEAFIGLHIDPAKRGRRINRRDAAIERRVLIDTDVNTFRLKLHDKLS